MGKGWIKIRSSIPSKLTIEDIDAAVIVALRDMDDSVGSNVSIMSSAEIGQREALIHALPAIAGKIRSLGRCSVPGCEACDHAFRIADGIDAITGVESRTVLEGAAMASTVKH
jgi:hypothetical protein